MGSKCKHYHLFEVFPDLPVMNSKLKVEDIWSSDSDCDSKQMEDMPEDEAPV